MRYCAPMQRFGALLLAVVVGGCACTNIGCYSQVRFRIPADLDNGTPYLVSACIDEWCKDATLTPTETSSGGDDSLLLYVHEDVLEMILSNGDLSGSHHITLRMETEDGTEVASFDGHVEMTRNEPNGGWPCGPTCWQTEIEV